MLLIEVAQIKLLKGIIVNVVVADVHKKEKFLHLQVTHSKKSFSFIF